MKAHLILGAATGAAINAAVQLRRISADREGKFDWGQLLLCTAISGAAALLPDVLEPAHSPDHRDFFHSITAAALVAYAITGKHTKTWSAGTTLILGAAGLGYITHLAADAGTPKSIKFI